MQLKPLEAGGWGGVMVFVFFFMWCLFVVIGWLWDAGCGFECTLLVPKVRTILIDTGAFVSFVGACERHLKIFYIR